MKKEYYELTKEEVLKELNTSNEGLTDKEVQKRIELYGKNTLPKKKRKTYLQVFLSEFKNPIVYILFITMILSFIIGEYIDAIFILLVVLLDALVGSIQEYKSSKKEEELTNLIKIESIVIRNKKEIIIPSEELVIGDIVLLESGVKVPADIRLTNTHNLTIDESILTGETIQREKTSAIVKHNEELSERTCMAYFGTTVMRGRGKGFVVATGINTEIGKISHEVLETEDELTPLQIRMNKFTKTLGLITCVLALIITIILYFKGYTSKEIFFLVVALSISAIPEGLPMVITMCLSISSSKMLKKNVLVKKLNSVEALGSATVIASDKTGTLTMNEQTAKKIILANNSEYEITGSGYNNKGKIKGINNSDISDLKQIIEEGVLNNEASLTLINKEWVSLGDSMDIALLSLGYKYKLNVEEYKNKVLARIPYESDNGYSLVYYKDNNKINVAVKGSLEKVLSLCKKVNIDKIRKQNDSLAELGYRVLAFASGKVKNIKNIEEINIKDIPPLEFTGLIAFVDPVRVDAKDAVKKCKEAGIKVVMITGDHPITAYSVGKTLGICNKGTEVASSLELSTEMSKGTKSFDNFIKTKTIFSRVTPVQKLEIVESYKRLGEFIAVTGDGVNDTPALKRANVGIAMGSGTDIAKETGSLIITDDRFSSIVSGVEEGRCAYDNIRKVIYMLLSCGVSEVVFYLFAILLDYPIPLTAIQLLWLNLVTDGIQDVALSFEEKEKDILKRKPRNPNENIFDRLLKNEIILMGLIMGIIIFGVWLYLIEVIKLDIDTSRSYIMLLMVFMQNIHCLNCRSELTSIFKKPLKENKKLILSILIVLFIQLVVVENSFLSHILGFESIKLLHVLYLFILSLPIIPISELLKYFERERVKRRK